MDEHSIATGAFTVATMSESKDTVTEATLKHQVEEFRRSNAVLQTENEMFESFLGRLDSLTLASQLETEKREGRSESSGTSQEPPDLLTLEQKYYIAACELEEIRKELGQFSTSSTRNVKYYKAALEDSDMRLAEIKKERHDFEQFVAKTQQKVWIPAQRTQEVIGYIERKIKAKEALTERMQRRNALLRMENWKKQRTLVPWKQRMYERLRKIDLKYQKWDNVRCRDRLQELQEELLSERTLLRKTQQDLYDHKEQLRREMQESEWLSRKIASHEKKLSKISEQQPKAEKEQAQAEALNKKLKAQLANFRAPDVMKYIEAKATHSQLRQTVKTLERKARIAEMASKTMKNSPEESSCCSTSEDH